MLVDLQKSINVNMCSSNMFVCMYVCMYGGKVHMYVWRQTCMSKDVYISKYAYRENI